MGDAFSISMKMGEEGNFTGCSNADLGFEVSECFRDLILRVAQEVVYIDESP